jgi:hypothetical protein
MISLAFAGFLFGAIGIAVPIILHFIKRKPTEITKFPSFMFFHKNIVVKSTRNNIRKWLVLILRSLAILLLSLAFAWPYIANFAKKPKRATVYIWDNSFSMTAEPYIKELKKKAEEAFNTTSPETPAILGIIGSKEKWMRKFTSSPEKIKDFLETNSNTESGSLLNHAIQHANLILQGMECSSKEIIIFSDKQKSPWKNVNFRKKLSPGVKIATVFPSKPGFKNAAITSISTSQPFVSKGVSIPVKIILQNFSDKKISGLITLFIDKRKVRSKKIILPPGAVKKLFENVTPLRLAPQQVRAEFTADDDITADNTAYLALNPVTRIKIAINGGKKEKVDYLQLAYGTAGKKRVADFIPLNSSKSVNAQFAIIREAPTPGEIKQIEEILKRGKKLFIIWNSSEKMGSFLKKYGVKTVSVSENRTVKRFGEINFEHPLFKNFIDVKIGSLFNIAFFDPPKLTPPANSEIIAKFADGTPAIFSFPKWKGRITLLASKITRKSTNWPVHATFLPFMRELANLANSKVKKRDNFNVGDTIPLYGASEYANIKNPNKRYEASKSFSPENTGNYILYDKNIVKRIISVNTIVEESKNIILPQSFTVAKLFSDKEELLIKNNLSNSVFSGEQGRTFWWIILSIALILMISELLIANRTVL